MSRNRIIELFLEQTQRVNESSGTIRIFRAQPIGTTTIRVGDYVTPLVKFAVEHAENNHIYEDEPHVVVTAIVNKSDIREATNRGEYLSNVDVDGEVIYTSKGYEYEGWEEVAPTLRNYLRENNE